MLFRSAEIQRLHDCAVALDVDLLQVFQQRAALADQAQQCALGSEVVLVAFEVFRKVADTVGKQRDLTFGRTRVGVRLAVLAEKLLLFLSCLISHCVNLFYVPLYDASPLPWITPERSAKVRNNS